MLEITILNARGEHAARDELASLFATDMAWEPYHRKTAISRDGVIRLECPGVPVILHAKLALPGYGFYG
jgi:hypothetical protein